MTPREARLSRRDDDIEAQPNHRKDVGIKRLSKLGFNRRLASAGLPTLIYTYKEPNPKDLTINLSTLQRMNLLSLQKLLIDEVVIIDNSRDITPDQGKRIKLALSDYATALRDWDMSIEYSAKAEGDLLKDPYIISSANSLQRDLLVDAGLMNARDARNLDKVIDADVPMLPGQARIWFNKDRSAAALGARLIMAIFGGLALIAPMLLMVLHQDLLTNLLTVSTSVFIVGASVAVFSSEPPTTVMAVVAGYAAVLVVFVGTSSSSTTSS